MSNTSQLPIPQQRAEQNSAIIQRYMEGDQRAALEFFTLNKPLISIIIHRQGRMLPPLYQEDLRQEALYGFYNAGLRYDPSKLKGSRPESFFLLHIKAAVQNYARKKARIQKWELSSDETPERVYRNHCESQIDARRLLRLFMRSLSREEKIIVKHRWFRKKLSYTRLGARLCVSREYVRKIDRRLKEEAKRHFHTTGISLPM